MKGWYKLTINHRIAECVEDFIGKHKLSESEFAKNCGIGRMTLRRIMYEGQFAPPSDIAKIAEGLCITVERLCQSDGLADSLYELLAKGFFPAKTLGKAKEFFSVAMGKTERACAMSLLGRSLDMDGKTADARGYFQKSYEISKTLDDLNAAKALTTSLLVYLVRVKDFAVMKEVLSVAKNKGIFDNDEEQMGRMFQYLGMCYHAEKDYLNCKLSYEQSLHHYQQFGNPIFIGRVQINLAKRYYMEKEYQKARHLLDEALKNAYQDEVRISVHIYKDYGRVLKASGDFEAALQMVDAGLKLLDKYNLNQNELNAKLLLLKADLLSDGSFALKALSLTNTSSEIKAEINRFLVLYYSNEGQNDKISHFLAGMQEALNHDSYEGGEYY